MTTASYRSAMDVCYSFRGDRRRPTLPAAGVAATRGRGLREWRAVSIGTAFHPRTAPLNRKMQWREWSGYYAASMYADAPDIEYNAIREAAALIDVSPLYKYLVSGPDAPRFVDRVQVRTGANLSVNQVFYTCWCDEDGKVVDDGTITRLDETTYRWTAADQSLRWFRLNSSGLDVDIQ